jgi:hypothetical protein
MAEMKVRMSHPKLPGVVIEIRESGVEARLRAGWKRVTDKTAAPAASRKKEN